MQSARAPSITRAGGLNGNSQDVHAVALAALTLPAPQTPHCPGAQTHTHAKHTKHNQETGQEVAMQWAAHSSQRQKPTQAGTHLGQTRCGGEGT